MVWSALTDKRELSAAGCWTGCLHALHRNCRRGISAFCSL